MCCEKHPQSHEKEAQTIRHDDCSCEAVYGNLLIKLGVGLLVLSGISSVPCARGEIAEMRLDYTSNRGATDLLSGSPFSASLLGGNLAVPGSVFTDFGRVNHSALDSSFALFDNLAQNGLYKNFGNEKAAGRGIVESDLNDVDDDHTHDDDDDHTHDHDDHDHDHDHDHEHGSITWHVVGGAIVMVAVGYFGAVLPLWMQSFKPGLINACNAFGAGGFWGLGFTHLLMESTLASETSDVGIHFNSGNFFNGTYPFALLGYLILLWIEVLLSSFGQSKEADQVVVTNDQSTLEDPRSIYEGEHSTNQVPKLVATASITGLVSATLALTIHAFLEGLIVGLRDEPRVIWLTVLSVCLHKWAVCLSISSRLHSAVSRTLFWSVISIFIFSSGVGAIVGLFVGTQGGGVTTAVLNALTVGVVFYVAQDITNSVFHDDGHDHHAIGEHQETKKHGGPKPKSLQSNLMLLLCITLGGGLIFGATCLHLAEPGAHVHH